MVAQSASEWLTPVRQSGLLQGLLKRQKRQSMGGPVLTDDPSVLTACKAIDILVEVTGTIEAAAHVVLEAFDHDKHVVLVNAELDSVFGPILKARTGEYGGISPSTRVGLGVTIIGRKV